MTESAPTQPPGWYYAQGDPAGTQRYWDGSSWVGNPRPVPGAGTGPAAPGMNVGAIEGALADPTQRILARLIDFLIWIVVGSIIGVAFGTATAGFGETDISFGRIASAGILTTALVAAYEIFMVGSQGGTLGKMALGMKVVNEDGSPADMQSGLRRMFIYIGLGILGIIPAIGLLGSLGSLVAGIAGLVMLYNDDRHQTPWDKVGKTLVVKK